MIGSAQSRAFRLGLVALALSATTSVLAQSPPAGPVCTGGTVADTFTIFSSLNTPFHRRTNIVSVPAVSSFHGTGSPNDTGFHRICEGMGLITIGIPGTLDIDGDGAPDAAVLEQINARLGIVSDFVCDGAAIDPFPWNPAQAVDIRLDTTSGGNATLTIDGDECTQPYAAYRQGAGAMGTQLVPRPYTGVSTFREDVCKELNLPQGSQVTTFLSSGFVEVHLCGQLEIYGPIQTGHGVVVQPVDPSTATVPGGSPVNCASPSATPPVCPPTPAPNAYPCLRLSASDPLPWYCN